MSDKLDFLERLLGTSKYSQSTKEAEFTCCFEGCSSVSKGKKKLSVNLETDAFQCWVCEKRGRNLFFLIAHVGNKNDVETYNRLYKSKSVKKKVDFATVEYKLSLPDGYKAVVECKKSVIGAKAMLYLTKVRGLSESDILRHKIGVITDGEFSGRLVFPSFAADGKLNFYTTRTMESAGRYNVPHVPRDYKNHIVLNELNIDWDKPVTITEGFLDMLKANDNCVPLFGSFMHKGTRLFSKIVENNIPVYLALDPDADKKARFIAKSFLEYDIPVYQIPVRPFKDVGSMTKEEFAAAHAQAVLLSEQNILLQRIRNLC